MKKYKLTIIVDEYYVADSLHEIASEVECGTNEVMDYSNTCGDHYQIGEIVELNA
ncbi:MAG: hypothetical protein MJ237_06040 [bacterium]|nr:hypothetical protein [bacterium]